MRKLVNWELICERFFGSDLLRCQINFAADTLLSVAKANDLAKKYMLKQDLNSVEITIPRLIAFKTILHMRIYKDKLAKIEFKEQERSKLMGTTIMSKQKDD